MLYMLPSIFVQRLQARPSSLRRAPLCGGPPDEMLSWHRHQSPPPPLFLSVPGVQEGGCSCCGGSPFVHARPARVSLPAAEDATFSRMPGGNWVIVTQAGGENKVSFDPSRRPHNWKDRRRHQVMADSSGGVQRSFDGSTLCLRHLLDRCVPSPGGLGFGIVPLPFTLHIESQRAWKARGGEQGAPTEGLIRPDWCRSPPLQPSPVPAPLFP